MVCRQKRNHGCPATMVIDKENDGVIKRLHTHTHDNGYNGAIAKGCPDKATLWTLIQVVRKEEALAYKKVTEALKGQNKKTRPRDIRRRARQNCLRNVVLNYEATTQRRYIQEVSSYYNIAIR
eukprot:TRINITY_DN8739_c0_g1_i1.p1 TRINITY_DN8739_c0_g1~~TRINITY_DN8739_c0_g1_i1.p1  ORF type:complete len:123 (+),score=8.48 TRINITY_DN8739_c0_g1_i1:152-520(+)